ncbi:MAG: type II toxin-antitoxin system VapB family antitoxin [Vicinamibacterales bacterium]|nr:type II toxin-antitoxin system VapB family antitoxin [Vicinamibacterales bacterium]
MALYLKHPDADRLARELARTTGESLTDAVITSLRERLARERGRTQSSRVRRDIRRIRERCAALRVRDSRPDDDILGYGPDGIPR